MSVKVTSVRSSLILALIFAIFSALVVFKPELILEKKTEISWDTTKKIAILVGLLGVILSTIIPILTKFLNDDTDKTVRNRTDLDNLVEKLQTQVAELSKTKLDNSVSERVKQYVIENLSLKDVEEAVYDRAISNIESHLLSSLEKQYQRANDKATVLNTLEKTLNPLEFNIEEYIEKLQRNSIVNLIIGIVGTITAITILSFSLLTDKHFADFLSFTIHFLPRFVFVVSIQFFAFFFLRLYKNNLDDAKYFQNELTNIACKTKAIKLAYLLDVKEKVAEGIEKLSTVERNFKLGKEETLLSLEKAKLEKEVDLDMLSSYKEFLRFLKKENGQKMNSH